MNVFFSTFPYALSKQHPASEWPRVLSGEVESPTLPCFRTLLELRSIADVSLHVDVTSRIGFCRSRAVGAFLRSGADVWVTCDDDVFADADVLGRMMSAAVALGAQVGAPYVARTLGTMIVGDTPADAAAQVLGRGIGGAPPVWVVPAWTVGGGLCAMARSAILRMVDAFPELKFIVKPVPGHAGTDETSWALYQDAIIREQWSGEDVSFCARAAQACVPRYLLCDALVTHEGVTFSVPHEGPALDSLRVQA